MNFFGLVESARRGDKESLIKLIMDKKDEYYRLAYVYMENKDDALDAMQDMIVILYESIHKLQKADAFYSWSKTILVNCCKTSLRRSRRVVPIDEYAERGFEENFESRDSRVDILKVLKSLNKNQQEAIKFRYLLDMDYETISRITQVPLGTVKSRISLGLSKLRELFGGEY
jgi:RNA polymerase sigma factor (sigma-70 family)